MPSQFFRANVGIVVVRGDSQVLAFERLGRAGQWQLPQGGLNLGEEPIEAALRELREETSIQPERVELVAEHPGWLAYELPSHRRRRGTGRGQAQKWFRFRFLGSDADIDLRPSEGHRQEFSTFCWMRLPQLTAVAWEVRQPIYAALLDEWPDLR